MREHFKKLSERFKNGEIPPGSAMRRVFHVVSGEEYSGGEFRLRPDHAGEPRFMWTRTMSATVRLYAWHYDGWGAPSLFVAAASEDEARAAVERYAAANGIGGLQIPGYKLTILDVGEVAENPND